MALFFDMFKRTVSLLRSSQTFKQSGILFSKRLARAIAPREPIAG
jgi:hypothetical protein